MATAPTQNAAEPVLPLEPGDVLTSSEFERRWEATPNLKRAELINGVVYFDTASPEQMRTDSPDVPPLNFGDILTSAEFERRFNAMPNLKKAELINGMVYMNAAVSWEHGANHTNLDQWLATYAMETAGVRCASDPTCRLREGDAVQPDSVLRVEPEFGGRSRVAKDGYLAGPPELVAEAASSTASYDLHQKLEVYRLHGVEEYIVLRIRNGALDWFRLMDNQYQPLAPGSDGILRSVVFPGLWLDAAALIKGDMRRVLAVLNEGLATAEHRAFVEKLGA